MKHSTFFKWIGLFIAFGVFTFTACAPRAALQGRVVIADQKLPYLVNQKIYLRNSIRTVSKATIDNYGFFEFKRVKRDKPYTIEFDSLPKKLNGSIFYIASLNGKKIKEIDLSSGFTFRLLPLELDALAAMQDDDLDEKIREFKAGTAGNEMLVRKYIHYETGAYCIAREHRKYMNAIVRVLKENTQFILRVNSHADATGNDDSNLALSMKRANEIKNYLVKRGIASDRIVTYGYGETRPVNNCVNGVNCSEIQHRQNRRTEFVFKTKKTSDITVRG